MGVAAYVKRGAQSPFVCHLSLSERWGRHTSSWKHAHDRWRHRHTLIQSSLCIKLMGKGRVIYLPKSCRRAATFPEGPSCPFRRLIPICSPARVRLYRSLFNWRYQRAQIILIVSSAVEIIERITLWKQKGYDQKVITN